MSSNASKLRLEALPQDLSGYEREANNLDMAAFEKQRPYPFLLYTRSNLWDRTLLIARGGGADETRVVDYNLTEGGMIFVSPVRKIQSDPALAGITLGRSTHNDVVVPVSSVSSNHAKFFPPTDAAGKWTITDLGSRNGTFKKETQLHKNSAEPLDDGLYLRLGGNLIAWFLYPGHLWKLLNNKDDLSKLTDL